jgi:hypothetical protein
MPPEREAMVALHDDGGARLELEQGERIEQRADLCVDV